MPKQYRLSPLFLFIGYLSRRMTSVIDCVVSYIAIAFSFCFLVYIIPSFLSVQDFVRRPYRLVHVLMDLSKRIGLN